MEKIKNVSPEQTSARWINNGWAVVGEKAKLNELKVGQYFLKDHLICFINVVNKSYVSWYDLIMREHCTSNTEQLVSKIKLLDKSNEHDKEPINESRFYRK